MKDEEPTDEEQRLQLYRRLWEADLDEVHELIAVHGTEILAHGRPYLLTALRRRAISRWRKEERRSELEREAETLKPSPSDTADPAVMVERRERLSALGVALNNLPSGWLLVVWRRAEGRTYKEIAQEWVDLDFGPKPTEPNLRQIHRRALEQLRSQCSPSETPS